MNTTQQIQRHEVGDFVAERLVTDTKVWEVIRTTEHTMVIRTTQATGRPTADTRTDPGAHGLQVMWQPVEPDPTGVTKTVRRNKHGGFAVYGNGLRAAPTNEQGQPVGRIDYRF